MGWIMRAKHATWARISVRGILPTVFAILLTSISLAQERSSAWPQWGGPNRDFKVASPALADSWPPDGPPKIWSRSLGDGYSAIVADQGVLYTMYHRSASDGSPQEAVIAVDADSGKTKWEHHYDSPFPSEFMTDYGPGPNATPLIAGSRLFTVGSTAKLHAFDTASGKVLWSRDLYTEFQLKRLGMKTHRGYSSSPIAYKDTVILPLGGRGQAVAAFDQKDGSLRWKAQDFKLTPSSPALIELDGQQQLVVFMSTEIAGLDPDDGDLLWSYPHKTEWDLNILTPVWGEDGLLFVSSAYDSGSRVVRLSRRQGKTSVENVWYSRRMRIHFGTAIRLGDIVYTSSGDFGPAFLMAVDVRTGKVLSRQRGIAKAQIIYADGKFIIMGEDGTLAQATHSSAGFNVISKAQIFNSRSWTVPTLVGTRLFLRNRESMLALDLSP